MFIRLRQTARHGDGLERLVRQDARGDELPGGSDIGGGERHRGRRCDGPVWMADRDCLAFIDGGNDRWLGWHPGRGAEILDDATSGPRGGALDASGRLVACEQGPPPASGRITCLEPDGSWRTLGVKDSASLGPLDDVAIASDGAIWLTALPATTDDPASSGAALARIARGSKSIEVLRRDFGEPGGLTFSPDESVLYVSDSRRQHIRTFAVSGSSAIEEAAEPVLCDLASAGLGYPQGLAVDEHGNVYCAVAAGIAVIDESGRHLGTIDHGASTTTNVTWGGTDGRSLFFTTAVGVGRIEMQVRGHRPTFLARATTAGSRGRARRRRVRLLTARPRIERHDERLDDVVLAGTVVRELASGGVAQDLGGGVDRYARSLEGPLWCDDDDGYLVFSDMGNDRRLRWSAAKGVSVLQQPTDVANGTALDPQGRVVACEHRTRRVTRTEPDGSRTVVADNYQGARLNRPNDLVVASGGAIYFTDPWWDLGAPGRPELDYNGVFRVSADLTEIVLLVADFELPNGLAFSPDEAVLYVNDSRRRHIRAFDVLADGTLDLSRDRVFCDLGGERDGAPDGMKVDHAGNVYCGGSGGVWVLDPTGLHLGTVVHGGSQTTNLAFGGPDWSTLFFTTRVALGCLEVAIPGIPVRHRDPGFTWSNGRG